MVVSHGYVIPLFWCALVRVDSLSLSSKVFLCRGKVKKQQLVVIKQIPLDELQNVERKAARNEVNFRTRFPST